MITATSIRSWELERTPDLIDLVSAARDAGHEVLLIERPMPEAVSVAALGRAFDIVAAPRGVAVEDASGVVVDFEPGDDRIQAAARMWRRLCGSLGSAGPGALPLAIGGVAPPPRPRPAGAGAGVPPRSRSVSAAA